MASDLVALQLILQYWTTKFPGWGLSLIFWVLLILANIVTVRIYGEVSGETFMINRDSPRELTGALARVLA